MPERIQLRRTKGWRKPEGTVVVSRPALWGNPYSVGWYGRPLSVRLYRMLLSGGGWNPSLLDHLNRDEYYAAAALRERFINRLGGHPAEIARHELRGRDLACWCPLDVECHADVLLEIANA